MSFKQNICKHSYSLIFILFIENSGLTPPPSLLYQDLNWPNNQTVSTAYFQQQPTDVSTQQHSPMSMNFAATANQAIPTLADRLETYRHLASGGIQQHSGPTINATAMLSQSIAANTMVSQSSPFGNYKTSLVERTQDLRNWLKQAKTEHEMLSGSQQADL